MEPFLTSFTSLFALNSHLSPRVEQKCFSSFRYSGTHHARCPCYASEAPSYPLYRIVSNPTGSRTEATCHNEYETIAQHACVQVQQAASSVSGRQHCQGKLGVTLNAALRPLVRATGASDRAIGAAQTISPCLRNPKAHSSRSGILPVSITSHLSISSVAAYIREQ